MWPFTSRRIFANRWWALAFVAYVCWQVADFVPDAPGGAATNAQAASEDQGMRDLGNALDKM